MSTTMTDINEALKALAAQVIKLDLTKEKEASKIKEMEKGITGGAEAITQMDNFDEERLTSLEGILKTANGKAEQYDPTAEIREEAQAYANNKNSEAKKIQEVRKARQDAAKNIKEMKERFSKQAKVLQIYGKLYNQNILEDRLKARTDANTRKIEQNQKKLEAIRDFEDSDEVKKQTEIIQKSIEIQKALESLKKEIQAIEKIEAKISTATTDGLSPEAIEILKEAVKGKKEGLKGQADTIATKYGITLDTTDISMLKQQVSTAEATSKQKSKTARDEIVKLALKSKDAYIKGDLYAKLNATSEPKDIIKVFGEERHRIGTENIKLTNKNTAVSQSVSALSLAKSVVEAGNATPTIDEPTAQEIQEQINADDTLKNSLANVLEPKEKNKQVYEWLLNEKGKENKGWHPILSWKAKHSKKVRQAWENQYNQATMEEATNRAKAKKQADAAKTPEAQAVAKKQTLEADFKKQLLVHVMGASTADLDKMLKDGEKGKTEATLDTLYTQLEDQEYSK